MTLQTVQDFLWKASWVTQALLVGYLIRTALFRPYRWFTAFLLAATLRTPILMYLGFGTLAYKRAWLVTELLLLALEVLAVLEAYRMTLECHRNLPGEIAGVLIVSLALASCAVFGTTVIGAGRWDGAIVLRYAAFLKRSLLLLLLLMMMIAGAIIRVAPTPMSVNLRAHCRILTVYIALPSLALFALTILGQVWTVRTNLVALVASIACFVAWVCRLSPAGEHVDRPNVTREYAEEINSRLRGYLEVGSAAMRDSLRHQLGPDRR